MKFSLLSLDLTRVCASRYVTLYERGLIKKQKACAPFLIMVCAIFFCFAACSDQKKASSAPSSVDPEVAQFIVKMNQHRLDHGCAELALDDKIAQVAQLHSEDMVSRNFFSHTNPDGKSPFDRLGAAGITYSAAGENIAAGASTGEAVLAIWLNSSGHRANIENCNYLKHGVGLKNSYWTHVFVK